MSAPNFGIAGKAVCRSVTRLWLLLAPMALVPSAALAQATEPTAAAPAATGPATPDPTPSQQHSSPLTVAAQVDRAVVTTGDILTYTVTVRHAPDVQVQLPEPGASIAGLRIVDLGQTTAEPDTSGWLERSWWFKLRADLVGSYVLQGLEVGWRRMDPDASKAGTVATSSIFVEVASVLAQDPDAKDIRDIKPLHHVAAPIPWWQWLLGGVAGLLLLTGLAWWWRRGQRRADPAASPPPPHETAFLALDALRRVDFSEPDAVRRYTFDISAVLRTYIEGRYGINATDLTQEEILASLHTIPPLALPDGKRDDLRSFLNVTDAVKFADMTPTEAQVEQMYEWALGFVEGTRTQPQEQAA